MDITELWIYIWEHFCCCIISARSPCCTKTVLSSNATLENHALMPEICIYWPSVQRLWLPMPGQMNQHKAGFNSSTKSRLQNCIQHAGSHNSYTGKYWSNSQKIRTMSCHAIQTVYVDIYWPCRLTALPKAYPKLSLQMAKLAACVDFQRCFPSQSVNLDYTHNKCPPWIRIGMGVTAHDGLLC